MEECKVLYIKSKERTQITLMKQIIAEKAKNKSCNHGDTVLKSNIKTNSYVKHFDN